MIRHLRTGESVVLCTSGDGMPESLLTGLLGVDHVDGVLVGPRDDTSATFYVIARRHGLVDRDALFALEDQLTEFMGLDVSLSIRARGDRSVNEHATKAKVFWRSCAE